jgi:hypothetical protein
LLLAGFVSERKPGWLRITTSGRTTRLDITTKAEEVSRRSRRHAAKRPEP